MKISKLRAQTSTRKLAGETIPRQDTTSCGMRKAQNRASGGRCEGGMAAAKLGTKPIMRANGGRLSTKERDALPKKDFALGGGRYPINDPNHARNALARVSQFGTPSEKERVRSAVHRKYPGIGKD